MRECEARMCMRGIVSKGMGRQSLQWLVKAEGVQIAVGAVPRRGVVPGGEGHR
jgi:hypothetical protein